MDLARETRRIEDKAHLGWEWPDLRRVAGLFMVVQVFFDSQSIFFKREFQLVCIFKTSTWKGVVWKFENFTIVYPEKN